MVVYRITDCKYLEDLSGKGAALYGGRWNSKDTYVVYTAQSRALSLLEVVVHIGQIPDIGFCVATIEIPDESIFTLPSDKLPSGWYNNPAPNYLKAIGDEFVRKNEFLALKIPSVLMVEEHNFLINPNHELFRKVMITSDRPIRFDERLFPQ